MKESMHFYKDLLGAERLPGDYVACPWLKLGALTLTLMPNASERSPTQFGTHAMPVPWLEVDDLAAAHAHLLGHGVIVEEMHEEEFMLVADPDGIIEIWQAFRE